MLGHAPDLLPETMASLATVLQGQDLEDSPSVSGLDIGVVQRADTEDLPLPDEFEHDAHALVVVAACDAPVEIPPARFARIPTGLSFDVPRGFQVLLRSEPALTDRGVFALDHAPAIDNRHREEITVPLMNLGADTVTVERRMPIARLVVVPTVEAGFEPVAHLHRTCSFVD